MFTTFGYIAKLLLLKCLHVNKRGKLNDERNTSKVELTTPAFGTMLNKRGHMLVTAIEQTLNRTKRQRYEQNSDAVRVSKRQLYEPNSDGVRAFKRRHYEQNSDAVRASKR